MRHIKNSKSLLEQKFVEIKPEMIRSIPKSKARGKSDIESLEAKKGNWL